MLKTGILNPQILHLLARVRHTNTLVIADRGFPFWPGIEAVDISLVDGIPTVLQVLQAMLPNFDCGQIWMAQEFLGENTPETQSAFKKAAGVIPIAFEPHVEFKKRVPGAIGLIRTGDTTQYANMILLSARI
jgi:D-ribose pyranase